MNKRITDRKFSIVEDVVSYLGSAWIIQGITFGLAIYIRNVLGPEAMGIWALMQVILNYVAYGNLGMLNAVCREIPILRGHHGEEKKIETIKNAGYSYILSVAVVTSGLLVLGTLIGKNKLSEALFYGLLSLALINLLQRINNYMIQFLQVEKKFVLISKFKVYSAIVNALLVIVLAYRYQLYGFYLATILSYVYNVAYLYYFGDLHLHFLFDKNEIKKLLKLGVPLFALSMAVIFLSSIDKISISKFLGLKKLGIYSIATLAGNLILMLPNAFQTVLYPRTLEKFGNESDVEGRKKYSTVPNKLMSVYFAFCAGLVWLLAPSLCALVLPKFTEGIPALQILVFAYCFLAFSQQMGHILLGYGKHIWMLPISIVLAGVLFGINYFVVKNGGDIVHIAIATTLVFLVYYLACAFIALSPVFKTRDLLKQINFTVMPLGYGFLTLILMDFLWRESAIWIVLIKSVIYIVSLCLFVFFLDRELGVIHALKSVWTSRKSEGNAASIPSSFEQS